MEYFGINTAASPLQKNHSITSFSGFTVQTPELFPLLQTSKMLYIKVAALTALFGSALTTPVASPDDSLKLAKRGEGIHLVNCGVNYSVVLYCVNDGNCNFNPGKGNQCLPTGGGTAIWESGLKNCTFPSTGTDFKWIIRSDAQSLADFSEVGAANNGFHTYKIFKDNKHMMYTDGNKNECRSWYYTIPI